MFNKVVKNAAMVLLGSFLMFGHASAKDKIGIVDIQGIAAKMPEMGTLEQRVKDEFKNQMEEMQKVQSDYRFNVEKFQREEATMSEDQKKELLGKINELKTTIETKGKPLQQAMQRRGQEEQNKILAKVAKALQEEAKDGDYDYVFHRDALAYAKEVKKVDISEKVLERAKKSN